MSAFDPIVYRRGDAPAPLSLVGRWTAPDVAGRVFQYDDLAKRVTIYPAEPELGSVKIAVGWPWWMRLFPRSERAFRLTVIREALEAERPIGTRLIVVAG